MFARTANLHVVCTPEQAFRHIALEFFTNHPRWDPDLVEVTKTSSGPIGVGTTGREVRNFNGRRFISGFRVTRFEPLSAFSVRTTEGAMAENVDYDITSEGSGSEVLLRLELAPRNFAMRLLGPFIWPRVEKNYLRNVARFEELLNLLNPQVLEAPS